jgi:hypothetical protein
MIFPETISASGGMLSLLDRRNPWQSADALSGSAEGNLFQRSPESIPLSLGAPLAAAQVRSAQSPWPLDDFGKACRNLACAIITPYLNPITVYPLLVA